MAAPSGSSVAPPLNGNTNHSKAKRDASKSNWFITLKWTHGINHTYLLNLKTWCMEHTTRAVLQLEEGEVTGYQHLQMQVTMKTKKRFEWFRHHLSPVVHCEATRNVDASYDYCCKEETRIWGPWKFPEPPAAGVEDPLKDKELLPWQNDIIEIITGPVDPRKIYWFWEPMGGVGKTVFCRHLMVRHDVGFFQGGKKSDLAMAYTGQKTVVFSFSRTTEEHVNYDAMEAIKDGIIFSGKYKSGTKIFDYPHVICFANWEPDTSSMSKDRWEIRRIPSNSSESGRR